MMNDTKYLVLLVFPTLFLDSAQELNTQTVNPKCKFDPRRDLNSSQVLYLHPNVTQFLYPVTFDSLLLSGDGPVLRVACPAGNITMEDTITTVSSILIECVGDRTIRVMGTDVPRPLSDFGCSKRGEAISQMTSRKTSNGKKIAEVGFVLGALDFVQVVDNLAVNKIKLGHVPSWAHYKVSTAVSNREPRNTNPGSMRNGWVSGAIKYELVYDRNKQREAFLSSSKNIKFVDKFLPINGTEEFVPSQLVNHNDLYYESEQNASYLYELTTPVFKSIDLGNWKLVNTIVHGLALAMLGELDVWSGVYQQLSLPKDNGENVKVNLQQDIKPARFLFKYVRDKVSKRSIVFVTINNPFILNLKLSDYLCPGLVTCRTLYPDFNVLSRGYTYCCDFADFKKHALNIFTNQCHSGCFHLNPPAFRPYIFNR